MLTTTDNPYDPFDNFDDWFAWDDRMGYHTPGFLARIAVVSDELSESDQNLAIETAIDEIVKENVSGLYKKVTRDVKENFPSKQ
jgi:hypothetical protein